MMAYLSLVVSLLGTLLPLLDKLTSFLPVGARVRADLVFPATLASVLCMLAGYTISKKTSRGLLSGVVMLVIALASLIGISLLGTVPANWERPLYITTFAAAAFSWAAFCGMF
jgi:hypothetical protein